MPNTVCDPTKFCLITSLTNKIHDDSSCSLTKLSEANCSPTKFCLILSAAWQKSVWTQLWLSNIHFTFHFNKCINQCMLSKNISNFYNLYRPASGWPCGSQWTRLSTTRVITDCQILLIVGLNTTNTLNVSFFTQPVIDTHLRNLWNPPTLALIVSPTGFLRTI